MPEILTTRPGDAIKPDGFVDFYELLEMPTTSEADAIRERINGLYAEAQANRDHRNMSKRRDYELLLELLPFARTVLLEPAKRARYDAYADDARAGIAGTDFEEFMNQLTGKADTDAEERAGLLGVADTGTRDQPLAAPVAANGASANGAARPAPKPAARPAVPAPQRAVAPPATASNGMMGIVIPAAVFVVLLAIGGLALHSWPIGLILGGVAGGAAFFVMSKAGSKIAS